MAEIILAPVDQAVQPVAEIPVEPVLVAPFADCFREECVSGSGIDPVLYDAAIRVVSEIEIGAGGEIYPAIAEALNWQTSGKKPNPQKPSNLEAALFLQADGSIWHSKLSKPLINSETGAERSYCAPKGGGDRIFTPQLPAKIQKVIAERYNVEIPAGGSFWDWLEKHPEIPIVITEGGKKSLAGLTCGFVTIGLYGCSCNPQGLKRFLVAGREIIIALDQDDKLTARLAVCLGEARLAKTAIVHGAIVRNASWEAAKGLDDLLVVAGISGVEAAITGSSPSPYQFPEPIQARWQQAKLADPELELQEFLLGLADDLKADKNPGGKAETLVAIGANYLAETGVEIFLERIRKSTGIGLKILRKIAGRSVMALRSDELEIRAELRELNPPPDREGFVPTADQLIAIGRENASYFKTPTGVVHADLRIDGTRQTVPVKSRGFRQYLRAQLFDKTGKSSGADALTQAIDTLEALASRDAIERKLSNRTARDGDDIYIDLANDKWSAIRITSEGWEVVSDYPVRFRRGGCAAMPEPIRGGSLDDLRSLCQFEFTVWVKILCWIVQAMIPSREYPILILSGVHGSGKTTITKWIKALIDPTTPLTRGNVGDVRSFAIHASKRHSIAIDNLSGLTPEQSDILSRAATGGGHSERTLQTDDEETIFEFTNPLILNGIDSPATRADLLDRSLVVSLRQLADRIPQNEFDRQLEAIRPQVFGALLDLISKVLSILPSVQGTYHGDERFTGFVEIGLAVEQAMGWPAGTVLGVLGESRAEAHQTAVESSPLGLAVLDFMADRACWTGPAGELLEQLSSIVTDKTRRDRSWPANGRWLSDRLCNRLAPDLKALGIEVTRDKTNGARGITIDRITTPKRWEETPIAQGQDDPITVEIEIIEESPIAEADPNLGTWEVETPQPTVPSKRKWAPTHQLSDGTQVSVERRYGAGLAAVRDGNGKAQSVQAAELTALEIGGAA